MICCLSNYRLGLVAVLACSAIASSASQAAVIPPISLAPGSQYQLIFVTAGEKDATSSDIADYNAFVAAEAALNPLLPATTWHAVASAGGVDAKVNAPSAGIPVYNTQGIEVTSALTGLYFDTTHELFSPVSFDQFGGPNNGLVWTGTESTGSNSGQGLGRTFAVGGNDSGIVGESSLTTFRWLGSFGADINTPHGFYALSSTIIVVPEPNSLVLSICAVVLLGGSRIVRRPRTQGDNAFQ